MTRLDEVLPVAGAEIDNVIEHDAGLRSVRDAARMLHMEPADVVALIERGAFPDAFQVERHWRIPLDDIGRVQRAGHAREGLARLAVLVRRRRPYQHDHKPPAWLLPAERRDVIAQKLADETAVRTSALSAELGVSQVTIRRDLIELEAEGRVVRTYGGAMAPGSRALVLAPARTTADQEHEVT